MRYETDSYYHIYNRGAHSESIFFEDENYSYLVSLFKKNAERYNIIVAAYCLMPNHYHLVLKERHDGSISSFLKTTFNTYTQAINNRFGTSGTLFQGQAKTKEIATEAYCLRVIPYVHLNPVTAKLVNSPAAWEFSNYSEWIGKRRSTLIDSELRYSYFSSPQEYEIYVRDYQLDKESKKLARFLTDEP